MNIDQKKSVSSSQDEATYKIATRRYVFWTGILLGIGIAGFLDETLLHQLLQWHTLYWNTDQHGRILSDGIFHVFSTILLLWGAFRLWRGRGMWATSSRYSLIAAILIGAGAFNLYDGIVQHAILHWHLVNELVCSSPASRNETILGICSNDVPYEIVFDMIALIVLSIGIVWWRRVSNAVPVSER